jgi:hypothetical protein
LPKLIETSILREVKQDRDNNPEIKEIQRLYGAIDYERQVHPVKITVKVTKNEGNKAYSYEVMDIENPAEWQGFSNDLLGLSYRNTLTLDGNTNTLADPLVEHDHPSKKSFRSDERNQTTNDFNHKDTNISKNNKQAGENPSESTTRFQVAGNDATSDNDATPPVYKEGESIFRA